MCFCFNSVLPAPPPPPFEDPVSPHQPELLTPNQWISGSSSKKDHLMKVHVLWLEIPLCNCVLFLLADNSRGKVLCLWQQGVNIDFNQ